MKRQPFRPRLTIGAKRQLIQICGEEAAEAITDWVAIAKEELGTGGEIPLLALALAELVRRYDHAEKSGLIDLAQILRTHLAGCATAIVKAENDAHSGLNRRLRGDSLRPQSKPRNKKRRR